MKGWSLAFWDVAVSAIFSCRQLRCPHKQRGFGVIKVSQICKQDIRKMCQLLRSATTKVGKSLKVPGVRNQLKGQRTLVILRHSCHSAHGRIESCGEFWASPHWNSNRRWVADTSGEPTRKQKNKLSNFNLQFEAVEFTHPGNWRRCVLLEFAILWIKFAAIKITLPEI